METGKDEIDHFAVGRLKDELIQQCDFVRLGFKMAAEAEDTGSRWFAIQGMLAAGAMVSKICWDWTVPKKKRVLLAERKELRRVLGITKKSPLANRKVRNHFEHFDGTLGEWVSEVEDGRGMSIRSGPNPFFDDLDLAKFGHLDPTTTEVTFLEDTINLQEMADEADAILGRIAAVGWSPVRAAAARRPPA